MYQRNGRINSQFVNIHKRPTIITILNIENSAFEIMMARFEVLSQSHTPRLNGETYITDNELSEQLRVSERTLQEWRTSGKIDCIQFEKKGKVLY